MQTMPIDIENSASEENVNIKENRSNKWLCAFDRINEGNLEKMDEKKINELNQKVISSNWNKEIITKTTNVGKKIPLVNSDKLIRTQNNKISNQDKFRNEPEPLKGTQNNKKTSKGLSALVRRISSDESNSTTNDKWPRPEDVRKAYLELNLSPPPSPNDVR